MGKNSMNSAFAFPLALALASGGCISIYGDISEIEDKAGVHESQRPDGMTSDQYAVGFAFGGNSGNGVDFMTVGTSPGGVGLLSFDADGAFTSEGQPTPGDVTLAARPPLATFNDAAQTSVLIGMTRNSMGFIGRYSPSGLVDSIDGISLTTIATGLAVGATTAGSTDQDVIAVGSGVMTVVENFLNAPVAKTCTIADVVSVAAADFVAGGAVEIGLVVNGAFVLGSLGANDAEPCVTSVNSIDLMPGAGEGFADQVIVGDFDGNSAPDVAISHFGDDAVYVIINPDGAAMPVPIKVTGTAGSRFGASIAAGDLDNDGSDELIVGASNAAVGDVAGAGVVSIQKFAAGSFSEASKVSRAEPETGDLYGRAVGVATFADGTNLVTVAANGKVFVNFRSPQNNTDPRMP